MQLPNFGRQGVSWPIVREAMLKSLSVPNTGMAITIDIGEENDIHPKNKQEVGRRLAQWALGAVYERAKPAVAVSGPLPAGFEVQGQKIVLRFKHTADGLEVRENEQAKGKELQGFEMAGSDRQWHSANARIEGTTVVVSSPDVAKPLAVRYAWANFPTANLYNSAGLPASPFRTHQWE